MNMQSRLEIAQDHASFAGHFPQFPILPGAVLLDEALEVIARDRGIDLTHWRIASAKFLDVVRPGDELCLQHDSPTDGSIRFTICAASRMVASGTLSNSQSEANSAPGAAPAWRPKS
jgi:3-hydroxymyristoyl/3-hydroxydecanoyl-(acyl carrier protein) dehydratase